MKRYVKNRLLRGLRFRLILLVLVAIIPALLLIIYNSAEQQRLSALQARESALKLARSSASSHEQLLEGARQLLLALSQLAQLQAGDMADCTPILVTLVSQYPSYLNLGVISPEGKVICSALPLSGAAIDVSDRPYYQQTIATQAFTVGEYQESRLVGKPVLTLAHPVLSAQGELTGVVFAGLDLTWLNEHDADAQLASGARLTIVDRRGTVLVDVPADPGSVGQPMAQSSVRDRMLAEEEGWIEHVDVAGVRHLYAFTPIVTATGPQLYAAVGIPEAVAFAESERVAARNAIAFALVAVMALAGGRAAGDWFILRRVERLVRVTHRIAAGDLGSRTGLPYEGGELNDLARAFDRMAEKLQHRETERSRMEQALLASARRSEVLVGSARRLNERLQIDDVLQTICEEATAALNVPVAILSLYDSAQDRLFPAAVCGSRADGLERWQATSRNAFDQLAARLGLPIVTTDAKEIAELLSEAPGEEMLISSVASTSMMRAGALVGVLAVVALDEPRQFTADEVMLLAGLADLAAQAISNAHLYDALQREEQARALVLHQTITAQEDERKRIARELHDETSQGLSAVMLGLDTLRLALATDPEKASERLETTRNIASALLGNIRRLIADLRPSLLDQLGLVPAVAWYGEQRLSPLGVSLHIEEDLGDRLPPAVETCLFRIVQEGLTNIVRHSRATEVNLRLLRSNGVVTLRLADNGVGFDPQTLAPHNEHDRGWGLRGIQERVSLLQGDFALYSAPGNGTVIDVTLPLSQTEGEALLD